MFIVGQRQTRTLWRELCKNSWTDRDAVWSVDLVAPRKHVLDGVHIGATWRMRLKRPCAAMMRLFCQITFITCYTINTASISSWIWRIISLPLPFSYQWQLDCTECDDMAFVGQSYEIKMRRLGTICNNNEQQYRVSTISCIFIMRIELKVLPMIDWLIDWFFKRLPH